MNEEIELLKDEAKNLTKEIELLNDMIINIQRFENSSILKYKDIDKKRTIVNWLRQKVNKHNISYKLIFKMSEQGSEARDFHKYCDNEGPTISLFLTNNNQIFGGFTPLSWTSSNEPVFDPSDFTFLFYLNIKKKYDMLSKESIAVITDERFGPYFGYDLGLGKNLKVLRFDQNINNFFFYEDLKLNGDIGHRGEFEVFKVI